MRVPPQLTHIFSLQVLVIGWLVFGDEMTPMIALGIALVFVGAYWYNRAK